MSAVDWEEVKRLAADFQRAQLTSSAQRLSERNCIEIISRLIEDKLIDVVFTTDGKEYITPQHLIKEIKDELYVSGGRINLVDLARTLCVDFQVVNKRAIDIQKADSTVRIINGQLINNAYFTNLCLEFNEKLQSLGQIDIGDLTSQYELPSDVLLAAVEKQLGGLIHGSQDKHDRQIIFTRKFVERNLALVRGALLAVTRPISIASLVSIIGVPERVFFSAADSLIERKEMPGVLTGKQRTGGQYVPYIYTRAQQQWVTDFYQQNGYLEYRSLTSLGISDPKSFVQKTIVKDKLLLLPSVAVGPALQSQIAQAFEEAVISGSFIKLEQLVPTVFDEEDTEALLQSILKARHSANSKKFQVFPHVVVISDTYLDQLHNKYAETVRTLAENFVKSGEYGKYLAERSSGKASSAADDRGDTKADKKDDRRRKAAEGKAGGGSQGRETKTKSTKKKNTRGKQAQGDSDEDESARDRRPQLVSMDVVLAGLQHEEIIAEEDDDALISQLAEHLHQRLNTTVWVDVETQLAMVSSAAHSGRKMHMKFLQEKLSGLLLNVHLFNKGLRTWDHDSSVQLNLAKYLLKTVCTDIVNVIFAEVGARENSELTSEQRIKIIGETPPESRAVLTALNKSIQGGSVDDFLATVEPAMGPAGADIMVYKYDKSKESTGLETQRALLKEQLAIADDPALVLHIVCLLVFQAATKTILHASGKFVSNIITFLKEKISPEDYDALKTYHDLVLQYLSNQEGRSDLEAALTDLMANIKQIALGKRH